MTFYLECFIVKAIQNLLFVSFLILIQKLMNSSIYRQILFGAKFHELRFILALSCGQKNTMAKCKRLQGKRPCWRSKICQKIESWWWWIHGELSSENFLKKFYMWAITKVLLVDNIMLIVSFLHFYNARMYIFQPSFQTSLLQMEKGFFLSKSFFTSLALPMSSEERNFEKWVRASPEKWG